MTRWENIRQFAYEIGGAQFTYELLAQDPILEETPRLVDAPWQVEATAVGVTGIVSNIIGPARVVRTLTAGRRARRAGRGARGSTAKKASKASTKPPRKPKRPTKAEVDAMTWYDRAIYLDLASTTNWNPVTASLAIHGTVTLTALAAYPWWVVYHELAGNDPFGDRTTGEVWPLLFGNN